MTMKTGTQRRGRYLLALIPVAVFAALAMVFVIGLGSDDPSRLPSALIDKPVPEFDLAALDGLNSDGRPIGGFASEDLKTGRVVLVNVWASWCVPCRAEHPVIKALSDTFALTVFGLNYKDEGEDARRFLGLLGNSYDAVGVDRDGRVAIDWGVTGVPETFIVDGAGRIRGKFTGPLTAAMIEDDVLPAVRRIEAATQN